MIIIVLGFVGDINAQQDNLWTTEFGSRSTLVGSAVTASVRDNSAIYYNPGALGFMEHSNIGLSANIATLYTSYIKNGGGDGVNMYYPYFSFVPQFISGIAKFRRLPDITFTYAIFNKQQSKLNFRESYYEELDLYSQFEGDEKYYSKYEYFDEINETWFGIGAGFLMSEKWSAGLSLFFAYRSETSFSNIENNVFDSNDDLVANTRFNRRVKFNQLGMIFKIGVAYEDEYVSWGATVTTTGIPTLLFDGASIQRQESVNLPGSRLHYYDVYNDWTNSWFKNPWELDAGVQFLFLGGIVNGRMNLFSQVSPYSITGFDDEAIVASNVEKPIYPNKNKVMYASKRIFNFAIGYEREVTENWVLLSGIKVDRNVFDTNKLSRTENWVPTISYWNLYSVTLGFDYITPNSNNIIFGLSYRFSFRSAHSQLVNLSDPDPDNYLLGTVDNSSETSINGLALVVGYTLNFSKPKSSKKDIRGKFNY